LIIDRTYRSKQMLTSWMFLARQYIFVLQQNSLRYLVIVTPDRFARLLLESARRLFPEMSRQAVLVVSLQEARAKLAELHSPAQSGV
jgi:hypothetical protein